MHNNRFVTVGWRNRHQCYEVWIKYRESDKGVHTLRSGFAKIEHAELWAYSSGYEVVE